MMLYMLLWSCGALINLSCVMLQQKTAEVGEVVICVLFYFAAPFFLMILIIDHWNETLLERK